VTGQIRIRIIGSDGCVKSAHTVNNQIQPVVRYALAAKMRDNTLFPDDYVPNFLSVTSNHMETVFPRIQSRAVLANGGMYFFTITQFSQGDDGMYVYSVGLLNEFYWPIAGVSGSSIEGVFFSPSDQIEVAYTITVAPSEANSTMNSSYFQEVSKVMVGVLNIIDYEADNSRYVVPNQARLEGETANLIDVKPVTPKGTGSFIGTSEGDLEWETPGAGLHTPYYARFSSVHSSRPDMTVANTTLEERLRTAYYGGTNIETRFSMELQS